MPLEQQQQAGQKHPHLDDGAPPKPATLVAPVRAASASASASATFANEQQIPLPRVTIRFCTQCKWMLRAAYYAQELISTFSTSLGEVALQPATGGVFVVQVQFAPPPPPPAAAVAPTSSLSEPSAGDAGDADRLGATATPVPTTLTRTLWDRKVDGGFPETKELKRRLRDVVEPGRNLGHVDMEHPRAHAASATSGQTEAARGESPQQQQQQQQQQQSKQERRHPLHHPAELITSSSPQQSQPGLVPSSSEQTDLAHRAAIATTHDDTVANHKCEDCL